MIDRKLVLMSGFPGSGKSTLGAALAEGLGFALISKDAMLMTLYAAFEFPPGDAAASSRTGAAAWAVFWQQARLTPRAVLDTNMQWANQPQREALRALEGAVVEVYCDCPPEVAQQRYADRATVGHAAQRYTRLDEERLALYDRPVGIGELVRVDTNGPVDIGRLVADLGARLGVGRAAPSR
ncbi:MAG: AAA family ATPase [Caulobacterales bacterium]